MALKKYDKRAFVAAKMAKQPVPKTGMLRELSPELYISTMYHATGARTLSGELQIVRELLEECDENTGVETSTMCNKAVPPESLSESAENMKHDEYKWFLENIKHLLDKELGSLVAHRGFVSRCFFVIIDFLSNSHEMCSLYFSWQQCEKDDSVTRPIENSLSSFEYAWSAGVHLAECDVVSSSPRFHCI